MKNERETKKKRMRAELLQAEEARLHREYDYDDAWRIPRNIGDSMASVGYALFALEVYEERLKTMSEKELRSLYRKIKCKEQQK